MSNFLAVATVTATLQRILQTPVTTDVPGATVTTERPLATAASPKAAVNVYLYQVAPNPHWRNADLPTRDGGGQATQPPQAALDLHYLLNFYGDDDQLEPQRLLGTTIRTLHAFPVLTRDAIAQVIAAASTSTSPIHPYLKTSDLGDQVELVRLTPQPLSLEDLSRLWAVFPDVPYTLSAAYQASVVLIQQDLAVRPGPPVRARDIFVGTYRRPVVDSVTALAGPEQPILATSTLRVRGRNLSAPVVLLRVAGIEVAPSQAGDVELELPLSALPPGELRAGVQPLQVVQEVPLGTPAVPRPAAESDVAPFVLHPTVVSASLPQPPAPSGGGFSATVQVRCDLTIGARQRAALLLRDSPGGALRHLFPAPPRTADASALSVPVDGVAAGRYAVQVSVDGAESPFQDLPAQRVSFP